MWEDPIVEGIRQARAAYAARFNYDLKAIYRDLKRQEQASGRSFVVYTSRRSNARAEPGSNDPADGSRSRHVLLTADSDGPEPGAGQGEG